LFLRNPPKLRALLCATVHLTAYNLKYDDLSLQQTISATLDFLFYRLLFTELKMCARIASLNKVKGLASV
jgi:hypothetical protein